MWTVLVFFNFPKIMLESLGVFLTWTVSEDVFIFPVVSKLETSTLF